MLTVYMDASKPVPKLSSPAGNLTSVFSGCSSNHIDCSIQGYSKSTCFVSLNSLNQTNFYVN